jgi:hypothetical protein
VTYPPIEMHPLLNSNFPRALVIFSIAATIVSSPILIFVSPPQIAVAELALNTKGLDSSNYHSNPRIQEASTSTSASSSSSTPTLIAPSTLSQGGDFTTQAALSLTRASQTSNIVNSKAYYDISFRTATAGAIKTVEIDFPPGTYVGAATLIETVGLGAGTIAASGTTGTRNENYVYSY